MSIAIYGISDLARIVHHHIEYRTNRHVSCFIDDTKTKKEFCDLPIVSLEAIEETDDEIICAIPDNRSRAYKTINLCIKNMSIASYISNKSSIICETGYNTIILDYVSINAEFIGNNNLIYNNVSIGLRTIVSSNVMIMPNAVIGNDCKIKDFTTIGPNCSVDDGITIETGSTIEANINIKENTEKYCHYSLEQIITKTNHHKCPTSRINN